MFYFSSRQVGIKNGMFFGYAKQLCPNLQAVPYDFHAYKEVARTLYETLARYGICHRHCVCVCVLLALSDIKLSLASLGLSGSLLLDCPVFQEPV